MPRVALGFALMFLYSALAISDLAVAMASLSAIALGLLAGTGLASALGLFYTPISSAVAFLCLGWCSPNQYC